MKAPPLARLPAVVLLGLCVGVACAAGAAVQGCTDGTTPVCDDGGSCLLSPSGGGDASPGGDAASAGDDAAIE